MTDDDKTKLASLIRTYNLQPGASLARFIGTGEISKTAIRKYSRLGWVCNRGRHPVLTIVGYNNN